MTHDADGAALLTYLRTNARAYFDGVRSDQLQVELLAAHHHRFSKTYRFRITGTNLEQLVLAKVLSVSSAGSVALGNDRPRLAPVDDWVKIRSRFEYQALCAASHRFRRIGDPHLGAVRPLEYIPEHQAIVMEVIEERTLRQLLWKATRLAAAVKGMELEKAFRHAGAWLREFHQLEADGHYATPLRETRADVQEALTEYTEFLARRLAAPQFFRDVASAAIAHSESVLPEILPRGIGHGDFAPRNIFVSSEGRVTVIDMIGGWRVPIYEDLAYFVTELRTAAPQRLTYGLAVSSNVLTQYENELLAGYFGSERVPHGAMAFFKLLLLLDRWSSVAQKAGSAPPTWRRAANQAITNRYFVREVSRLVGAMAEKGT
ncbi:MAG: aminoglycoside phosphotransferase family protein [Actinomycetota bacterium]|nr:aminoglycoside phosphotransferase family protein [Actinomycetota bacterium]